MKLVVDSNIFVSALDPKDSFHGECYPILKKILTFEIEAICPLLVLVEVTCKGFSGGVFELLFM